MDLRITEIQESFERGIRIIFQITTYVVLAGNIFDVYQFGKENIYLEYTNIVNITIIIVVLAGYYTKHISYKTSFTLIIYSVLINLFLGKFLSTVPVEDPLRLVFFLRDSLFVILLLALASFALHKIHALIIGCSYLASLVLFYLYSNNKALLESMPLIIIVVLGFSILDYYLVNLFEQAMLSGQEIMGHIRRKNAELNEINTLQEEKQQIIEEQAVKLEEQALELHAKNQELSQLNESKNRFFSIIAHDLKNPFNHILGFVTFLRDKFSILSEEKKIHYLKLIESTSLKTYSLLENLLQWAQSQTHDIRIKPEKINLNDIIADILNLYSERIRTKSLEVAFTPEKKYEAYADKDMLATVIRNLFSNAVKFSNPGGKITLGLSETKSFAKIQISDTGVGMPPVVVSRLFDIDYNHSTQGTLGETGSGLGLILCKEFIVKNGGTIHAESVEGSGSTFIITIPKSHEGSGDVAGG